MYNITPEEAKEKFTSLTYLGKKIIPDIFGRVEFFYVAEILLDQSVKLSGILKTKREEIPIEEVDLIFEGPPTGFIKGISLHFIGSDITYRELKRLPCQITLSELKEIQKEDINLVLFGEERLTKKAPRLILQDFFGITAELPNPEDAKELMLSDYKRSGTKWICRSDQVLNSLALLKAGGWKIETTKGEEVFLYEGADLDWDEERGFIRLKGTLRFEDQTINLNELKDRRQVPLEKGKVGLLPSHFKLQNFIDHPIPKVQLGLIHDLVGEAIFTRPKGALIAKENIKPNLTFQGVLRPYQQEGLSWLYFLYQNHFSGFLADDMGLGKTIQTLAFLSCIPVESKVLIVLPTSLKFNWLNEIRTFLPSYEKSITLVTYGELRINPLVYTSVEWEVLLLDEAQAVKNSATQIFKAVKGLHARFRLSISGTPIENRLEELHTHFNFLLPDLELDSNPLLLKKLTAPFILRRKKEAVLKELPDKVEEVVRVELFAAERELYDRFLQDVQASDLTLLSQMEILEVILRLRQLACHPQLAGFLSETSSKLTLAVSDIDTLASEERKVLVFSQFTSFLRLMAKALDEKAIPYLMFTGETKNREEIVSQFQSEKGPFVLLMSLKAGGVGLNLTAADTVLLLDPWWNEAVEDQAISRAHRIGQKNTLFVKRYLSVGTIEEKVEELKRSKKNLANQIISEGLDECHWDKEALLTLF